jgi:P27 family predicted phage terminase small subunit
MARGRIPQPNAVKLLRGDKNLNRILPTPEPDGAPIQPTGMTARAKVVWDRVIRSMAKSGVLAEADSDVLAAYCECVARWQMALNRYKREGLWRKYVGADGEEKEMASKAVPLLQTEGDRMRLMASELGLTPGGRARLKGMGKLAEPKDPFGEYMNGTRSATG